MTALRTWWEDLPVGRRIALGDCDVDRDEVIAFATRYDPQPFHVDEDAAAANPLFGRLTASGVHTFALVSRMTFDGFTREGVSILGGAGLEVLRFEHPVFPGDRLSAETEVVERRELASRADRGLAKMHTIARNQHGKTVISYTGIVFVARRP